ncbi:MAG: Na+/H+ antiporter NhaC [Flavobacteriales bacterium]|jgi:Na+:H+ antiporter, NhaC family|nr:Na+/H+ antiporter NhaC [Flavobacteriales bacterium]MBT5089956.1 Na+/H+ antiporter NhaC [Flavobacteriales bacterium]MBT5750297.1 Na+/H+ antiporter NhaC [Flavobacteriales bacterium]
MTDKKIPYLLALTPILFLIVLLFVNFEIYDDVLDGANQLALLLSGSLAAIIGVYYGSKWDHIMEGIGESIKSIVPAIIMLLLIGSLAGTWLISGVIPTMIYYGLQIINPKIFLFATAIITAIVSIATGSSWSTIATIGIALLGIGTAIGLPLGLIGGAIISGAYFGDKMSPLSDTTNMAAAISGVDLFDHIKYMMYTTIPSFIISLILFLCIGFYFTSDISSMQIDEALDIIADKFTITLWLLLVPTAVIFMVIKKISAIPALFFGTLLGGIFAILFQPDIVIEVSGSQLTSISSYYKGVINSMIGDVNFTNINASINDVFNIAGKNRSDLLKSGGMYGMLSTILLMFCAMIFSGSVESTGLLSRITEPIVKYAQNTGSLIATTACTCIFFNITTSDQYMSIVVPGRMFADTYKEKGLAPENLSRTLEDSGTVTSVLIPWNSCGATQSAVLGVGVLAYLPFCFFNLISPLMTIAYGYFGIKIKEIHSA